MNKRMEFLNKEKFLMKTKQPKCESRRRIRRCAGVVAVETALIVPVVVLITLGTIDVAQYINLAQVVTNSSREAARVASRNDTATVADVEASVRSYVAATFPNMSTSDVNSVVTIEIRDKDDKLISTNLSTVASGDPLVVNVSFDYSQIRWIPGPDYFGGTNASRTTCRRD